MSCSQYSTNFSLFFFIFISSSLRTRRFEPSCILTPNHIVFSFLSRSHSKISSTCSQPKLASFSILSFRKAICARQAVRVQSGRMAFKLCSQREGGSGSVLGRKGSWVSVRSSRAEGGNCASSNSRMMLAQLVICSLGSQVAWLSGQPFHLTRYWSTPPRTRFLRMAQTQYTSSPESSQESEDQKREISLSTIRSALVLTVILFWL